MENGILLDSLIITAVIALVGVSFTAIMNYISTIKVNNKKILHEENKIRITFTRECFDVLRNALSEIAQIKNDEPLVKSVVEANYKAIDTFNKIKPFLPYDEMISISQAYESTIKVISDIQVKHFQNGKVSIKNISEEENKTSNDAICTQTELRFRLREIIEKEIISLSRKLKKFNLQ